VSAEHRAQLATNGSGNRGIPKLDDEARQDLREAKKHVAKTIAEYGLPGIIEIIKAGPFAMVELETRDGIVTIPLNEERSRLWQYAMNFAADRCGLPRIQEMDLVAAEGIPPIQVIMPGFTRPSES
jgi:hypothetical protein